MAPGRDDEQSLFGKITDTAAKFRPLAILTFVGTIILPTLFHKDEAQAATTVNITDGERAAEVHHRAKIRSNIEAPLHLWFKGFEQLSPGVKEQVVHISADMYVAYTKLHDAAIDDEKADSLLAEIGSLEMQMAAVLNDAEAASMIRTNMEEMNTPMNKNAANENGNKVLADRGKVSVGGRG